MTDRERVAFMSQFAPGWYITVGGITGEVVVVVLRDIIVLYRHRRPKK